MRIEVFETESEALEAAAARIAEHAARAGETPVIALPGGRGGRALLVALAEGGGVPWDRVEWFVTDEVCGPDAPPDSAAELVHRELLAPNRVDPARLHAPDRAREPSSAAATWAAEVDAATADHGGFDLVVLMPNAAEGVAGMVPGAAASDAVAVVEASVTLGAEALRSARAIVVVATGGDVAATVGMALKEDPDPLARPLQYALPGERVEWFVDRAAVAPLLRDATQVEA